MAYSCSAACFGAVLRAAATTKGVRSRSAGSGRSAASWSQPRSHKRASCTISPSSSLCQPDRPGLILEPPPRIFFVVLPLSCMLFPLACLTSCSTAGHRHPSNLQVSTGAEHQHRQSCGLDLSAAEDGFLADFSCPAGGTQLPEFQSAPPSPSPSRLRPSRTILGCGRSR